MPVTQQSILKQLASFKEKYPDYLILFKINVDLYAAFDEDARAMGRLIGTPVVKCDGVDRSHAENPVEASLRKLIAAGQRVAIAEPAEAA